jgi:hypothetical protein
MQAKGAGYQQTGIISAQLAKIEVITQPTSTIPILHFTAISLSCLICHVIENTFK